MNRTHRPLAQLILSLALLTAPAQAAPTTLPSTYSSTIVDWPKGKTGTVRLGSLASAPVNANGHFSIVLPTAEQLGPELHAFSDLFAEKSTVRSDEVCKGQGMSTPTNARYRDFGLDATIDGGSPISLKLNSDLHTPSRVGVSYSYLLYFDVPTVLDGSFTCTGAQFTSTFKGTFPSGWNLPSATVAAISKDGVYSDLLIADPLPANVTWHLYNVFVGIGVTLAPATTGQAGVYITALTPEKPAELAGVRLADLLVEVNGKSVVGQSVDDVIALIRGDAGTVVTLGVMRGSETAIRRIPVTRALIQAP